MRCQKCNHENKTDAKFCVKCGTPLSQNTKKIEIIDKHVERKKIHFNKKRTIITGGIILVISICIGIFFIFRSTLVNAQYNEAIDAGQKYLTTQDYEKAEDSFLKALSIEPKKSLSYEKLYEVYAFTNNEDKMQEIEEKAQAQLSNDEKTSFDEAKDNVDKKVLFTDYTILDTDVPNFDVTPVDHRGEGYIVRENGKYGFITPDMKYVKDSKYRDLLIMFEYQTNNYSVCMFEDGITSNDGQPKTGELLEYTLNYSNQSGCISGFGGAATYVNTFDDENGVYSFYWQGGRKEPVTSLELSQAIKKSINDSISESRFDDTTYYILPSGTLTPIGPYAVDEVASFGMLASDYWYEKDIENLPNAQVVNVVANTAISGLFYEKTDAGYIVWTKDGTKSYPDAFEKAVPISTTAMKVYKDGNVGIVDSDANLVLFGEFEDATLPIDDKAFVKIDGTWKQIQINHKETQTKDTSSKDTFELTHYNGSIELPKGAVLVDEGQSSQFPRYDYFYEIKDVEGLDGIQVDFHISVFNDSVYESGYSPEKFTKSQREKMELNDEEELYFVEFYGKENRYIRISFEKNSGEYNTINLSLHNLDVTDFGRYDFNFKMDGNGSNLTDEQIEIVRDMARTMAKSCTLIQ